MNLIHGSFDEVSDYSHPEHKDFMELFCKVRTFEENRQAANEHNDDDEYVDINDYIVNPSSSYYSAYNEAEPEDNPVELTPEEKEARKQQLKSAKAAAKKDMTAKGQKSKQATTIKGGLSGLAALLSSERE